MSTTESPQQVTPELRKWILEQVQAGHSAEAVLKSIRASGWAEEVAREAMETTLRGHLQAEELPPGLSVPEPNLDESPLYIDAGDRQVAVLQTLQEPRVVLFGGLLSDEECAGLIELAKPRMARSLTVATKTEGEELNDVRTSNGMFFYRGENDLVRRIEQRIARLVNWPEENGEGLQILQYRPGAEYKPHYDYFDPLLPGTPSILKRGGQRVGTLIMYLCEPAKGGGTTFPDVRLEVAPKRGNAVFFSYDRPHPSSRSLHAGTPVLAGEKWIATKWLRERRYE